MATPVALIAAWARSAVVPRNGAFKTLHAHDIAAPVVHALLQRAGVDPSRVDALVVGNALGAGGNPARMLSLHAGLPERCAAFSVDTQCCAGLDAVAMGVGLIASGQAHVVVAGGVEAWSRSPIRMHRPLMADETPVPYERPAFAPTHAQDPDMLMSAARFAAQQGYTRAQQEAYAIESHRRALAHQAELADEIVPIAGVQHDPYPRQLDATRVARMPVVAQVDAASEFWSVGHLCALSTLTISAQADGAAFVLLMSPEMVTRLGVHARFAWLSHASVGSAPETPLLAAEVAAREALLRAGRFNTHQLGAVELHDAFAAQGLNFAQFIEGLGLAPEKLNTRGGGLARGHPIGASAAIALVRLLADMSLANTQGLEGMVAVAGAGGLGAAAVISTMDVS
jgi:acetyl-CoA C-acetyltransferase